VVQQLHVQVTISFTGPDAIALGERSLSEKKFFFSRFSIFVDTIDQTLV
jgi:hypothetical protein